MLATRILAGWVVFCMGGGAASADWPMLGGNPGRSGATATEVRPPFARKWYRLFGAEGLMSGVQPVVSGKRLYIGTLHGILHCIDTDSGQDVWTLDMQEAALHAAAVGFVERAGEDVVFIAGARGSVYAVRSSNGKTLWMRQTGGSVWNAPVLHGGLLVLGDRNGHVYAFDAARGDVRWTARTDGPILNSPAIDVKTNRVYVGSEEMRVYALDLADGKRVWRSDKLPGVSVRGYHPVIAPDGSVMITVTPHAGGDAIQQVMLDMVKEVFGNFSSWRIRDEQEKKRIRAENFELMKRPETYRKQLDYIRRRLADEPALQTFFVLDPETGKQKFVTPLVYAESMNGPGSPPIVTPEGKVIVKYSALLRSRYEHYSPFLNVGYLDTATGRITPLMDESRTYGWHDSLLLVHDEQSQLAVGGDVLINTHQNDVNALDLKTLKGDVQPWAHHVHEVKAGTAAAIWARHLSGRPIDAGWEWLARGTAVYGGGSTIDVPVVICGDSFYYLPTHEINAGAALVAYRMDKSGTASKRSAEPADQLTMQQWRQIKEKTWDWDMLSMPRLDHVQAGLPEKIPGTRQAPRWEEARAAVAEISDREVDELILAEVPLRLDPDEGWRMGPRKRLGEQVAELIGRHWRPLLFPAAKAPSEAYRLFVDPSETLYTLALAYPHLDARLQAEVRGYVEKELLTAPLAARTHHPNDGEIRSEYDPAPEKLIRVVTEPGRSDTARLYPLYLWSRATDDWRHIQAHWPVMQRAIEAKGDKSEVDCGNGRVCGLIAACRIAKKLEDRAAFQKVLPQARATVRERLVYEWAHSQGGVITSHGTRTYLGRWRNLSPGLAHVLRSLGPPGQQEQLVSIYLDHHRPTWWLAWNVELLWRNESSFGFPSTALEAFAAKALLVDTPERELVGYLDRPWCRGDETYIQKLALILSR